MLILTSQVGPISNCALDITVLRSEFSTKWIYTKSLKRKLYSLDGRLKSSAPFVYSLWAKENFWTDSKYQFCLFTGYVLVLELNYISIVKNRNLSSNFEVDMWTCFIFNKILGGGHALPTPLVASPMFYQNWMEFTVLQQT